MVVVHFLWLSFVCTYYGAQGGNFKAKAWERACRSQLITLGQNFPLESINSALRIAPIEGTIVEARLREY